jgi:hypothetical protein
MPFDFAQGRLLHCGSKGECYETLVCVRTRLIVGATSELPTIRRKVPRAGLSRMAVKRRRWGGGDWHGDEKFTGEKIVVQSVREGVHAAVGRQRPIHWFHSIPRRSLNSWLAIPGDRRLSSDRRKCGRSRRRGARGLRDSFLRACRRCLQRSNEQGKTRDEAHQRLGITVYGRGHAVSDSLSRIPSTSTSSGLFPATVFSPTYNGL